MKDTNAERARASVVRAVDSITVPPGPGRLTGGTVRGGSLALFAALGTAAVVVAAIVVALGVAKNDAAVVPSASAKATKSLSPSSVAPTRLSPDPVWAQLRGLMPTGVPIIAPQWLPPRFQTASSASLVDVVKSAPASYTVIYYAGNEQLRFIAYQQALQSQPTHGPQDTSGMGTTVRRSWATLTFPTSLFSNPGGKGLRSVEWNENGYELRIESDTVTGDDLLHVAWSLDETGAPAPASPAPRSPGACASTSSAEDTVRNTIGLLGRHDTAALGDCFALAAGGYAYGWTPLPSASLRLVKQVGEVGGRVWVQAQWDFASDPGGAWSAHPTNFFLVGLEGGVYRIFEVGTAGYGTPP